MNAFLKRHKHYKVFIDLDGTLLDSSQAVSPFTKAQIVNALNEEIEIWICSGRPHCFTQRIADTIDSRIKKISFNGCMIENNVNQWFNSELLDKIMKRLKSNNTVLLKTQDTIYSNQFPIPESFRYIHPSKEYAMEELPITDHTSEPVLKILVLASDDYEDLVMNLEDIQNECECSFYKGLGVEITPKSIHKGFALDKIREEDDYLIAIGNDVNDLPMFEVADLSVAMKESHQSILNRADLITDSFEEDGVGKFIQQYLLNIKGDI